MLQLQGSGAVGGREEDTLSLTLFVGHNPFSTVGRPIMFIFSFVVTAPTLALVSLSLAKKESTFRCHSCWM